MASLREFVSANKPGKFQVRPYYSSVGDALTVFFKDDPAYAVRVDDLLTVYESVSTEELVGCEIKGLRAILDKMGELDVRIQSGKVDVRLLFLAYLGYSKLAEITGERANDGRVIKELRDAFARTDAKVELVA